MDLNAISPGLSAKIGALIQDGQQIVQIDGGIIGGVPYPKADSPTGWNCPSLIVSGPTKLPYQDLVEKLNIQHISPRIGAASGLKMCFGSMTKGFYALSIQSYVTADALGILPELRGYLDRYIPATLAFADKGVVTMPPKAYRWVDEMKLIGATMQENGGFDKGLYVSGPNVTTHLTNKDTSRFDQVAEVYRIVANDTELGLEQPRKRKRGTTVDDVVEVMRSGMKYAKHS